MTPIGAVEVIALDGPSGTGKSTVSRAVATALGWRYLDTGAMYRAATWAVLRAEDSAGDAGDVVRRSTIAIGTDPAAETVTVDGVDVRAAIRSEEVTAAVSAVSAVPAVRELLVARQRELVGDGRIVIEGRDIGSVVVPDARLKVFLTANADVRARRRATETAADPTAVAVALARRDDLDRTRQTSPLRPAPHAVEVDTSGMEQTEVVEHILALAEMVLR